MNDKVRQRQGLGPSAWLCVYPIPVRLEGLGYRVWSTQGSGYTWWTLVPVPHFRFQ